MENLNAKIVNRKSNDYKKAISLMKSAFPAKELVPITILRLLSLRKDVSFLSFYDNDLFVGIAYIVRYKWQCFIFYLAVNEEVQGKGYGSKIIAWIKENNKNMSIILDVEAIDSNKDNYKERLKRVEFYHRNGIIDTGYRLYDLGIKYMVLSSKPSTFNPNTLVKCWRKYAFGLYTNKPFKEE